MDELDQMLEKLAAETAAFQAHKKAQKQAGTRPAARVAFTKSPSPHTKPGMSPEERKALLEELRQRKISTMKSLSEGILPGGWEYETLLMQTVETHCSYCHSRIEALSPPAVYLVTRQSRKKDVKHLRPLKDHAEVAYFLKAVGLTVTMEHNSCTIPACKQCIGDLR